MKLFAVGLSCKTAAVNVREQFAVSASARPDRARVLIDRYRSAGLTSIAKDFYSGGRHEMLHEINRRDVITNLLVWMSGVLDSAH